MAKKKKAAAGGSNRNVDELKRYVDQIVEARNEVNAVKAENREFEKDLKVEIKSRFDELGFDEKEVFRLAALKMEFQKRVEDHEVEGIDIETVRDVFAGEVDEV